MGLLLVMASLLVATAAVSADRRGGAVSTMSGLGGKLLGAKSCTYGPSYWCDHVKNARECHAMDHCTQAVWLKQNEPQDSSPVCRWCDDLMDDLKVRNFFSGV